MTAKRLQKRRKVWIAIPKIEVGGPPRASSIDYATAALRLHGFRECDIAACNCGSWHAPPNLRAEKAEAERDAWKAKAIRDPSQLAETLWSECYADLAAANVQNIAERDALAAALRQANENLARASADYLRDTEVLRAQVAKMEAHAKEDGAAVARCLLVNERLRAQVEAARAVCAYNSETLARDVLAAMDGAKPK